MFATNMAIFSMGKTTGFSRDNQLVQLGEGGGNEGWPSGFWRFRQRTAVITAE